MFDEPVDGKICLVGVNDLPGEVQVTYSVKRISGTTEDAVAGTAIDAVDSTVVDRAMKDTVLSGKLVLTGDSAVKIDALPIDEGEKEFYLIEWEMEGQTFKNHYFTNIIDIDYQKYLNALNKCGMDEFEGF